MPLEARHFEDLTRDQQLFQIALAQNPAFAMEQRHFESLTRDQQLFQLYSAASSAGSGTLDSVDSNQIFGDGADGDLNGGIAGAGIVTLTTDMYWNKVTLGPGDAILLNTWKLYVQTLDLTHASPSALRWTDPAGMDGFAPVGTAAGVAPTYTAPSGTLGTHTKGAVGKTGGTSASQNGQASGAVTVGSGGRGGSGGNSGSGNSGALPGAVSFAGGVIGTKILYKRIEANFMRGSSLVAGGSGGSGGASGAGGAGFNGGASASGGSGGGFAAVFAKNIIVGPLTPALCFDMRAGNGAASAAGTTGGGGAGGGGGGGGGAIYMVYSTKTGPVVVDFFNSSGGNGGAGGGAAAGGAIGLGGQGGNGGSIIAINALTGVVTFVDATGSSPALPAGTTVPSTGFITKMSF
jgi:hypothetical protein